MAKVKIQHWQDFFEKHILDRGYHIMESNAYSKVISIYLQGDHVISASVYGTELYKVEIKHENGEVKDLHCDCPYAYDGNTCKHMAAVLYYLEDEEDDVESSPESHLGLDDLLNAISKEDLIAFFKPVLETDEVLLQKFRLYFNDNEDDVNSLIRSFWQGCSTFQNKGFINYNNAPAFYQYCHDYLEYVEHMIDHNQVMNAVLLLIGITKDFDDLPVDDSAGHTYAYYDEIHELLERIIAKDNRLVNDTLIKWLENVANNEKEWYLNERLSDLYDDLMLDDDYIDDYITELRHAVDKGPNDEWNNYKYVQKVLTLLNTLVHNNKGDEAYSLCLQHLEHFQVKVWQIEYLSKTQSSSVTRAIEEGLNQFKGNMNYSLTLYGMMRDYWTAANETEKARESQWAIVELSGFDETAYCAYKDMFTSEEWQLEWARVKDLILQKNVPRYRQYIIFGLEKEVDHLKRIQEIESTFSELKRFEVLLYENDPLWLFNKYKVCLLEEARKSNYRKQYKQVANLMKTVARLKGGKAHMSELATQLKSDFVRRPAFVDELNITNL